MSPLGICSWREHVMALKGLLYLMDALGVKLSPKNSQMMENTPGSVPNLWAGCLLERTQSHVLEHEIPSSGHHSRIDASLWDRVHFPALVTPSFYFRWATLPFIILYHVTWEFHLLNVIDTLLLPIRKCKLSTPDSAQFISSNYALQELA